MDTKRRILVFGESAMLGEMVASLRVSPLLEVECASELASLGNFLPDVILVDAEQITAEQFCEMLTICPIILSLDPDTYQLTLHSFPHQPHTLADLARVVGHISLSLPRANIIARTS